jgi:ferric-dicitrate binding protein FerR (iron transport regulator)
MGASASRPEHGEAHHQLGVAWKRIALKQLADAQAHRQPRSRRRGEARRLDPQIVGGGGGGEGQRHAEGEADNLPGHPLCAP